MCNDEIICVICNEPINVNEGGFFNHPTKPKHLKCFEESPDGIEHKKKQDEIQSNPYVYINKPKEDPKPKRYCWFHRNDCNEKIPAVCYWYQLDGNQIHACEGCAGRYGKERKIHWYGEREGINHNIIEPFDDDCDHVEYKKNMVTDFDNFGSFDIIACKKCGGQRKRRFGGA